MASGYWSPLSIATAASTDTGGTATALTILHPTAKFTFPPNSIQLGTLLRITATGHISCVITTPGSARYTVLLGATTIFDTGVLALRTGSASTTLPWWLDINLSCRLGGSAGNFFGMSRWTSEASILSPLATTGPAIGTVLSSVAGGPETAPAVGSNVDLTASNTFDCQFTSAITTGHMVCHTFVMESGSIALT